MPRFDDARVAAILSGRRRVGRFAFPGSDKLESGPFEIGIRLLSDEEIDTARFNAQFYLEKRCKAIDITLANFIAVDPESLDREHMRQILFLAVVDADSKPESPERFFKKDEDVRKMDAVLVKDLWDIYTEWQEVVNPRFSLTPDKLTELVDAIKKESEPKEIFGVFERSTLINLAHFMATQLGTSPTGKSVTSTN